MFITFCVKLFIEFEKFKDTADISLPLSFISKFYQNFRPRMDRVPKAKYSFSSSLLPSSIETNKGTHAAEILGPASEIVTPSEMLSDDRWPEELENNGGFDSFFRVYEYTRATTSNRGSRVY